MREDKKRTWAEVRLSEIGRNYDAIRDKMPASCKFMGVVKADAYGHGAVQLARYLESLQCDYLAVACLAEAEELRRAGSKLPILILGVTPFDLAAGLFEYGLTQTVESPEAARAYSAAAVRLGKTLKVHYKLETGMGRLGFNVRDGGVSGVLGALRLPKLEPEGIFTHLAASDEPEKDAYTKMQFHAFMDAVETITQVSGVHFAIRHCANSGAVINYPQMSLDMIRPGLALYGVYPGRETGGISLTPAMALRSRIAAVSSHRAGDCVSYGCTFTADRDLRIAVLPIGYADGLHRCLSNKLELLVRGTRCRQIGRICMDMCMADVTGVPDVQAGDVATIFGRDGDAVISADEVARKAGTISYEIFCSLTKRVPRAYIL
ncbi:MAG: alanine racemase [Oscillospiraceae bacterium]|jgi:alanine racemase|nr:alanine racemase [Oscillospiraceae bacterium]